MLRHAILRTPRTAITHSRTLLLQSFTPCGCVLQSNRWLLQRAAGTSVLPRKTDPVEVRREYFEETFRVLRSKVSHKDTPEITKYWDMLSCGDVSEFLSPLHYSALSEDIAVLSRSHSNALGVDVPVLEEIALVLATRGHARGLDSMLTKYIMLNDIESTLRIYGRFKTLVPDLPDDNEETQHLESEREQLSGQEFNKGLLRAEMLMYAIAACALQSDFRQALHFTLEARCFLPGDWVRAFINRFRGTSPSASVIELFVRRATTATILARPQALHVHVFNLVESRASVALHAFYDHLLHGLTGDDPWLTLKSVDICERTPLAVHPNTWGLLLLGFMRCGKLDWAEELWDNMSMLGVEPTSHVWDNLIQGYGHLRMPERVLQSLDLMLKQGLPMNIKIWKSVILSLVHCGRGAQALAYFETFQRKIGRQKLADDDALVVRSIFNALIGILLRTGEDDHAYSLLQHMEEAGPPPDIITMNHFLKHHGSKRDLRALGDILRKIDTLKLAPDKYTWSIMLTVLTRVRDDALSMVFDYMGKYGQKPNAAMYTTIINGLVEERTTPAFSIALRLLQEMETSKELEMRPTAHTYTSLLCGIHRKNWMEPDLVKEYTEMLARRMTQQRIIHSLVSYHTLIDACLSNPEPEGLQRALWYYREMRRRRVPMWPDTWYILLSGLIKRQEWGVADAMVDDLQRSGVDIPRAICLRRNPHSSF